MSLTAAFLKTSALGWHISPKKWEPWKKWGDFCLNNIIIFEVKHVKPCCNYDCFSVCVWKKCLTCFHYRLPLDICSSNDELKKVKMWSKSARAPNELKSILNCRDFCDIIIANSKSQKPATTPLKINGWFTQESANWNAKSSEPKPPFLGFNPLIFQGVSLVYHWLSLVGLKVWSVDEKRWWCWKVEINGKQIKARKPKAEYRSYADEKKTKLTWQIIFGKCMICILSVFVLGSKLPLFSI